MNGKIKEIFNQIQAEEKLKDHTRSFLVQKTEGFTKASPVNHPYRMLAAACACLLCLWIGGYRLYFTPTAEISIDINPSIEIGVNRFDRVVSVNGYNDGGWEWLHSLDIKFMNYTDAMDQVLGSEKIAALLSQNEVMTITVTGTDETQSSKILSKVESSTAEQKNTHCYFAPPEEVAAAHELGLSYGKYQAFLQIQMFDPSITPETIQKMTMREVRDLMDHLPQDHENETQLHDYRGQGRHGFGNGYGNGRESGRKRQGNSE